MSQIKSSLVGESAAIQSVLDSISKVAQSDSTVLITGESGTGKELVVRAIHDSSARRDGPLVIVNCGAIPGELLEAELFGHVRGAFTGATQDRQGRFSLANGGTLFLDEVGEMPLHLQVKLLRVLQTQQFEPVGSSTTIQTNARIISATNADLEDAVSKRAFREDLFYRLNVIPVRIPSLRERKSDIKILIRHFVDRFNTLTNNNVQIPLEGDVFEALMNYAWPGNVRELENLVERMVILKSDGTVEMGDLPQRIFRDYADAKGSVGGAISGADFPRMALPNKGLDLKAVVAGFENHLIDQALARTNNNKNRASELLQMNRTTLVEKLRRRGMIVPAKKRAEERALERARATSASAFGGMDHQIQNTNISGHGINSESSETPNTEGASAEQTSTIRRPEL